MGSSTRNKNDRAKSKILDAISNNLISSNGSGIGNILQELVYPKNGESKIKKTLNENLYSPTLIISIKKIIKLNKEISSGSESIFNSKNIDKLTKIELNNLIIDYLEIENNEILKTSVLEAHEVINICDNTTNVIDFLSEYIKNIISNIFKQYTYEDTMDCVEEFDDTIFLKSLEEDLAENLSPIINDNMISLDIEKVDDNDFADKIKSKMASILISLKRIGE